MVLSQQFTGFEFSIPIPFVFHFLTDRQERSFTTDANSFTEGAVKISIFPISFEKLSIDKYLITLIREYHVLILYYIQ